VLYLDKEHKLEWSIDKLDSSKTTANLEIKTASPLDSLFPFEIKMSYPYSILGAKVSKVIAVDSKQPITYSEKISMTSESYQIVFEI
jgi:hypothetical protein